MVIHHFKSNKQSFYTYALLPFCWGLKKKKKKTVSVLLERLLTWDQITAHVFDEGFTFLPVLKVECQITAALSRVL